MAYQPKRRGLITPEPELATEVRELILEQGPAAVAEKLQLSRETVLSIGVGTPVLGGSIALARARLAETGKQSPPGQAAAR